MTARHGGKSPNELGSSSTGFHPTQDWTVFSVKFVIVYVILEANSKTSSFPKNHHPTAAQRSHRGGGVGPLQVEQSSACQCGAWASTLSPLISVDVNLQYPILGPLRLF